MGSKYDVDEMVRLYGQGLGLILIGKQLGCAPCTVKHHLRQQGVQLRNPPKKYDIPFEEAQRLYEVDGWSLSQLADKYGVSGKRMHKISKRLGWTMRRCGGRPGSLHHCWKGGRKPDKDGYMLVHMPTHPASNSSGYVREHRLVMEHTLGRFLTDEEVVHHLNDIHDDNRPENLELFASNGAHLAKTLVGKCPNWTPEGKARILEGTRKRKSSRKKTEQCESELP